LRNLSRHWTPPVVSREPTKGKGPFKILLSTVLSLRSKDDTTGPASERVFALASTPREILKLGRTRIERAITKNPLQTEMALGSSFPDRIGSR